MAGAGFKTFTTGEVLTAANVNEYLMQQTVMVFASAAARTTALGANVAEGMLSYLKDTDQVEVYNGSSWVASDDPNAIQNSIVDAKGDLISATADNTPARLGIGTNGQVLTVDTSTSTGLKWATASSGTNFAIKRTSTASNLIWTIAYNGSNLYVAAGANGTLYTSPDAQTWTTRTSGFGSNLIRRVIYANGIWVAVGGNGTITTSTDGITWTARTSNMSTNMLYDVHYAASTFVVVGNGGGTTNTGGIAYSSDGITWTRKSQSLTVGAIYYAVIYNGTNWIVGASVSTNNALYASTPSGTWTPVVSGSSGGAIERLAFDGTRTIFWDSTYVGYTTSTTFNSGIQTYDNVRYGSSVQNGTYYYNGYVYQMAGGWLVQFSTAPGTNANNSSDYKTPIMTPLGKPDNAGLQWDTGTPFAGAAGIILGTNYGEIYTTF